jgi:iron complex outermembrane receptor protein
MSRFIRAACAAPMAFAACLSPALAEPSNNLPEVVVRAPSSPPSRPKRIDVPRQRPAVARPATVVRSSTVVRSPAVVQPTVSAVTSATTGQPNASLTVPTAEQARKEIEHTPGAVEVVRDTQFKNTPAVTIKDIVDYVPGVWAQPKWGDDSRLSIRGSGLSRNFHLRGIQLYMDGIPLNTSDGYGDFQEIDPTAYRYVEIFKGANALQFGANSLGGAINFVVPSGRDARAFEARLDGGSFGFLRGQASSGGANDRADYFVTGSALRADGYRDHSWGDAERGSANFGYRLSPDAETRFYFNANQIRQRIPGEVTKSAALDNPKAAWTENVVNDWQRNIDSVRFANKTAVRLGSAIVEFGAYGVERHLMHPIFQWLDYTYHDYGGFGRIVDDRNVGGYRNRLVAGVYALNGTINAKQYANTGGNKGALLSDRVQTPQNYSAYLENSFYVVPNVALVAGTQYLFAVRDQLVRFSLNGDPTGRNAWSLWSPKAGFLWDVDPGWQVFGNISRSAEVPSFGESVAPNFLQPNLPNIPWFGIKAQTATTYEIGTRGRRPDYTWDIALYHAAIQNELMCFFSAFGNCNVTNADRTIHRGVELGLGLTLAKSLAVHGTTPDRIWLNLAYTLNDFRYDNDATFGNNLLPGAPPQFIRAELLYKHPSGFSFGPNVEWVPQPYYVDSANTWMSEPYVLWGLKAAYDDERNFSAYVEGRNLADKAYISSASIIDRANPASRLFNPGTGRGVFAGLRGRW